MKTASYIALIVAALSFIFAVIARLAGTPIVNVSAVGYINFVGTCLLATIAFSLIEIAKSKQG